MEDFKSEYITLKQEGFTDKDAADIMNIPLYVLTPLKKYYKVPKVNRVRRNKNGITEEQFKKGLTIGLTRRLMNKRVRELGYTTDQACTFPKNSRRGE